MMFIVLSLVMFFVYMVVAAVLILLERKFIRQRKKGEWILPVIVTVLVVAILTFGARGGTRSSNIDHYVSIMDGSASVGELHIIKDRQKAALGVDFLKLDNGEGYLEVKFHHGELVGSKDAMRYKDAIMKSAGSMVKGFTGSSLEYDDFQKLSRKTEKLPIDFKDWATWYNLAVQCIIPVILWVMFFCSSWRRKKRNQLDKTKLEDL